MEMKKCITNPKPRDDFKEWALDWQRSFETLPILGQMVQDSITGLVSECCNYAWHKDQYNTVRYLRLFDGYISCYEEMVFLDHLVGSDCSSSTDYQVFHKTVDDFKANILAVLYLQTGKECN